MANGMGNAVDLDEVYVPAGLFVGDSARRLHEVDNDLIGHAHHGVPVKIVGRHVTDGLILGGATGRWSGGSESKLFGWGTTDRVEHRYRSLYQLDR